VSASETPTGPPIATRGVRVRHGDFTEPASLAEAFEGATQVLVVSAATTGASAVDQHAAVFQAALAVGARRLVYTSHQAAREDSLFAPMPDHAATERYLAGTDAPFTALRNGFYASFVPRLLAQALQTGQLIAPADGPVSWTTHADLAEAAGIILADEDRFEGPTPPLTAPEAFDLQAVAGILSDLTGRPVRRVIADDTEFVAGMVGRGVPQGQADMLLGMFRASRRGEFATTNPTLENLIGRPTTSLRSVLQKVTKAS